MINLLIVSIYFSSFESQIEITIQKTHNFFTHKINAALAFIRFNQSIKNEFNIFSSIE